MCLRLSSVNIQGEIFIIEVLKTNNYRRKRVTVFDINGFGVVQVMLQLGLLRTRPDCKACQ